VPDVVVINLPPGTVTRIDVVARLWDPTSHRGAHR
jgi:hypothetical protein